MASKRPKKFDGKAAMSVVAGGVAGAGVTALMGWLGANRWATGGIVAGAGLVGAALAPGYSRLAVGATAGAGLLTLMSSTLATAKKDKVEVADKSDGDKKNGDKKDGGKKRNADLNDDVVALFDRARADLALDDEERNASRAYRAA